MTAAIEAVSMAFRSISDGEFVQPARVAMPDGSALVMIAKSNQQLGTVVKVLTIRPDNPKQLLPTIHATVLWIDDSTGQLVALLDGPTVTALRTGAATGVATHLLAAPSARVLGMLGAGAQASDQIRAVLTVREIVDVKIASRSFERARRLATSMSAEINNVNFAAVPKWADAVRGADVICCATPSVVPLISAHDLNPRVHINAIGAYTPTMVELEPELLRVATTIAVDQIEAALMEAGDIIQAIDQGVIRTADLIELGALLSDSGRPAPTGCTVFKSVGIAAQDWAVTRRAVDQASKISQRT